MFGGTYFGEGYFAGEPATQQAQADNAPPAPVVPPVVPPPSNWAPSAFLTRLTADPVTIDALGVPLVARVQLAPSATPVPWMTRPRVTEPPSSVPVVPFIASLAPSRAIPVAPVIARSTADPVPDVPPAPLVARAVPAVFVPAPLVDRVTADPAPDAVKLPVIARAGTVTMLAPAPAVTRPSADPVVATDAPTRPLIGRALPPPGPAPVPVRTTPAVPTLAVWRFASTSPTYTDPAVTVSAITAGSTATVATVSGIGYPDPPTLVITSSAAGSAGSLVAGDYAEFTVTPAGTMDLAGIVFTAARGGASTPRGVVVRSSVDGFTTDLFSSDLTTQRPALGAYAFALPGSHQGLTAPVTFRVWTYTGGVGRNVDLDDLAVLGVASTTAVPGRPLLVTSPRALVAAALPLLTRSTADPVTPAKLVPPLVGRAAPTSAVPVATVARSTADPVTPATLPAPVVLDVLAGPAAAPAAWSTRSTADPGVVDVPAVPVVARVVLTTSSAPAPVTARQAADPAPSGTPTVPLVARAGTVLAALAAPFTARSVADPPPPPDAPRRPVQALAVPGSVPAPAPVLARAVPEPADVTAGARPVVVQVLAVVQLVRALLTGPRVTDPSPARPPVVVTAPPRPAVPTVPQLVRLLVDNSGVPVYAVASTPPASAAAAGSGVVLAAAASSGVTTVPAGQSGITTAPSGSTPPSSAPTAWGG